MVRLIFCLCLIVSISFGQSKKDASDIVYAEVGDRKLLLDLYFPNENKNPYLIVWIHGGAWHSGSKASPPLSFVRSGYALASVDYRLSIEAKFPAPVHDIKTAIRFLRTNAEKYGYRSDKIIIAGSSAGGHLAALVGVTNNDKALEGNVGQFPHASSTVQAIIDYYGPTNFTTILKQSTPHGVGVRGPALALLLGHTVDNVPELAKQASPALQVDSNDPPLLIFHGDQDIQVPINQSHEIVGAYKRKKLMVHLEVVHGGGHSESPYFDPEYQKVADGFLRDALEK